MAEGDAHGWRVLGGKKGSDWARKAKEEHGKHAYGCPEEHVRSPAAEAGGRAVGKDA